MDAPSYVVVVRPGEVAQASYLRRLLGDDPAVDVVVDRRHGERRWPAARAALDRRRTDRRRRPPREAGIVFDMPSIVRRSMDRPAPAWPASEESAAMETDRADVSRGSIERWISDGQSIFARLIEENETQRRRADVAEREGDKIRQEAGVLARELAELRHEVEQLHAQQAEAVETFLRVLTHTDQMLRPVNELLERLKRGTRRVS